MSASIPSPLGIQLEREDETHPQEYPCWRIPEQIPRAATGTFSIAVLHHNQPPICVCESRIR